MAQGEKAPLDVERGRGIDGPLSFCVCFCFLVALHVCSRDDMVMWFHNIVSKTGAN